MESQHTPPAVAEELAAFVAATAWTDLSAELRHEAKRSLLNFIGCALGVAANPCVEAALRVFGSHGGGGNATVYGRRERLDPMSASFVNAIAGNLLDFDDTHLDTVIHPTAPVAPPALALAETQGLTGAQALLAFVLGAEVECRVGNAVSPGHYARGWHITSTCGVFGSAAATAKLLGLDAPRIGHALGIAASQSAGLVENLSTPAKNVSVGNAARNGYFAALMAQQGYTAAPEALEGPLGWARAMGDAPRREAFTGALGERWEFARNTYKPYPCGIVMHSVIDACLALRDAHGIDPSEVERITVRGDALLLARGDRPVNDERDARVSIHHAVAAALLWGPPGVREFSTERVMAPQAVALRQKVRAELDATLPTGAATVSVEDASGGEHSTTVRHARGSERNPLGDDAVDDKVRAIAEHGTRTWNPEAVIAAVRDLDRAPDLDALMRALRPPGT